MSVNMLHGGTIPPHEQCDSVSSDLNITFPEEMYLSHFYCVQLFYQTFVAGVCMSHTEKSLCDFAQKGNLNTSDFCFMFSTFSTLYILGANTLPDMQLSIPSHSTGYLVSLLKGHFCCKKLFNFMKLHLLVVSLISREFEVLFRKFLPIGLDTQYWKNLNLCLVLWIEPTIELKPALIFYVFQDGIHVLQHTAEPLQGVSISSRFAPVCFQVSYLYSF